ncbi:MAG: S9 family peptidase [Frankiaceae bacterium]
MSLLRDLLEARSAHVVDLDAGSGADRPVDVRVLVRTDDSGTMQLVEWIGGGHRRLTDLREPVTGRYVPGRRAAVIAVDEGGNEQHQLHLLDLDRDDVLTDLADARPVAVDPAVKHVLGGVSRDGHLVSYSCNRRNGVDLDVWVHDLRTGEDRCVHEGGYCEPHGFSPDGRWVSFSVSRERPLDNDVVLVDLTTGQERLALRHDDAAVVGRPQWLDDRTYLVSSNAGRDLQALWRCTVDGDGTAAGDAKVVLERDWDVDCVVSGDGSTLLLVSNVDGATTCELFDAPTLDPLGELELPGEGVVAFSHYYDEPTLGGDGRWVALTFSSARQPATAYLAEVRTGALTLLAGEPAPVDPARLVEPRRHRVPSFDGEQIPVILFPPARPGDGPAPAVVVIHGGPEGQSMLVFNPIVQALADAGLAVVVPNVRGSTGYGKRYYGLDDTTKRLDSVRDLAALHAWLPQAGIDPARAALWGGSYGGYMVLAGVAFQPELWAAGVDIVGISDLVTFLERTSAYRRAAREREYGSLERDREFLASASPLRRVDDIRAPLLVIHGANDPRVPVSEARQLVESLAARGIETELLVYDDEGHGLAKLANRLDAYPRAIAFLDRVMGAQR